MLHAQNQYHIDGEDGKDVDADIQRCLPLKKRYPTCARCRNHGLILDVKGHKRTCEYRECRCSRCNLVSQRRVVMAKQVALSREQVRQHRQNRDTSDQQLSESQRFFQEAPTHPLPPPPPDVVDLTSERPGAEEMPYPVVQPSPDSTNINIGYCNSPYSPWEISRENISQPTQMPSSPQTVLGQAPQSYPASFNSSQIHVDDMYRSRMAFTANHPGRPIIPSPVVPSYQSNDPMVTYLPDRIIGATPLVNIPSSQKHVGVASQIYPTPFHLSQVDGTCRSRVSFAANHMVRPRPMVSNESIDALPEYLPYRLAVPSANFSSPYSAFGVGTQYYPTSFQSSQVDASYRCQVSMTANHTVRPVLPSPVVPQQSIDAVSAYRDNYPSAYSQCNSTVNTSFHAGDGVQSMCYCNVTDHAHWHPSLASHVSSSRVAPFEERAAASISSYPPSIMTTQTNCVHPDRHPLPSVTPIPYAFQTPDEPPMYSQNVNAYKENDPTFRSQVAATSHQLQGMPSIQSDYSSVRRPQVATTSQQPQGMPFMPLVQSEYSSVRRPQMATTSQQPQGMPSVQSDYSSVYQPKMATTSQQPQGMPSVQSDYSSVRPQVATTSQQPRDVSSVHSNEPSYRSRRPFPLRITIPSLQLNQSNCSDTPLDLSPTFSPSTLNLLTNVTMPTSDILSPGFSASILPTFNYPSPTLPTQSSPVFSYPSPYTNPSLHAGAPSFQDLVDSHVSISSHSTSNFSEQIRIPPKYDEDLDGDREGSEIDVCSLDQYGCQ